MHWDTKWTGKMWVAQQALQSNGKVFERVLRSPGSRIIIVNNDKLLLSKEKRSELAGKVDYRLPGGKVFDTAESYQQFLKSNGDIVEASRRSIAKEALEEVGAVVDKDSLQYVGVDILGATCTWDLHYWVSTKFEFHQEGAHYQESESDEIIGFDWVPLDKVKDIVLDTEKFSESRSAIAILRYLDNTK
jgi:8-oxo-dGTP pyrophosphatase MutT (NUDIX family)